MQFRGQGKAQILNAILAIARLPNKCRRLIQAVGSVLSQVIQEKLLANLLGYRSLDSFAEYLLVAQDEVRLEQHLRQRPGQWIMTEHTELEGDILLSSIDVRLTLSAIYRGVF